MEYSDFLGNDLFLIVETHEELINSLNGHYAQLMFQLQKKGEENTLKYNEFEGRLDYFSDLKIELANKLYDLDFQKNIITLLENELRELNN